MVLLYTETHFVEPANYPLRLRVALIGCFPKPSRGLRMVLLDAEAILIEKADVVLSAWESLICGLAIPFHSLDVISLDAVSAKVKFAPHVCIVGREGLLRGSGGRRILRPTLPGRIWFSLGARLDLLALR